MKRIVAWLCLLSLLISGCSYMDGEYTPTGDGLSYDDPDSDAAVSPEGEKEQELIMVCNSTTTMNPFLCTDVTNRTLFSLIYQSLFVTDKDYKTHPMLCGRYTVSDDMKRYTIYLAEGATYSDGTPVTLQDVIASYVTAKANNFYKGRFSNIRDIRINDEGDAIIFSLSTAMEDLPILLDIPIVKELEVEADRPLGSGPYRLDEYIGGLRLQQNKRWWCKDTVTLPVTATHIPLREAGTPPEIRDAFEFSDVGLVRADPGVSTYADYRCDYELWDCENGMFMYLICNTERNFFAVPAIRQALTHAIDRELIVEKYYNGFAHSAYLPCSPLAPYYSETLAAEYTYDKEAFRQAVVDAGMSGYVMEFLVHKKDTLRLRVARTIAEMLEEGGIHVNMVECAGDEYSYHLGKLHFDLFLGQTVLSPNMDLSPFFSASGRLRHGGLADEAIHALCKEALANSGNYYNLHQMVMENSRLCPVLVSVYSVHATRGLLTGLTPSRDNVFFYTRGVTMKDALFYEE